MEAHVQSMNQQASGEQIKAWKSSLGILKRSLGSFCKENTDASQNYIVLEYELSRERGRRPDVLFLFKSTIKVLEFKERPKVEMAYLDQVSAYSRDLNNYHEFSHTLNFSPLLVMASQKNLNEQQENVECISPEYLTKSLNEFWKDESKKPQKIEYEKWLEGDYQPLPSLIQAARLIFQKEPLPNIRRAHSAGIDKTLETLNSIATQAETNKEHHLALITGVPGAGKTLVGISCAYQNLATDDVSKKAVFLSGNVPLVEVLQYALKNKIFVQDVHGFLKSYGGGSKKIPNEHIIIFDEAQRAWDKLKVIEKRGHNRSEPEDFLEIGRKQEWCLLVGLIGEGQEIHLGEESGIEQWNEAIATVAYDWHVTCPEKLKYIFSNSVETRVDDTLNLTLSLRSHLAADVQIFVSNLLEGHTAHQLSPILNRIESNEFDIYITRELVKAKKYLTDRYSSEPEKRYGLLASSKDSILPKFEVYNDYMSTLRVKKGPWFIDDRESPHSCCQFSDVLTEFGCQGLELDYPIVCWGNDFIWKDNSWSATKNTKGAKNSYQLRKNSYRVLLSRGRDGFTIFIPQDSIFDETYNHFRSIGLKIL
jgi:hypothetical protein